MSYAQIPLMSAMQLRMQYAGDRQAVLAQNVANADTPGYRAKDLKEPDFKGMVMGHAMAMTRTSPMHLTGARQGASAFKIMERKPTWETTPTENTVALDEEMQKISLNASSYQQVGALYRKTVDMFKTAIGRPGA